VQFTTREQDRRRQASRRGRGRHLEGRRGDGEARHSFDLFWIGVSARTTSTPTSTASPGWDALSVGLAEKPLRVAPFSLTSFRVALAGSNNRRHEETQEMLDYCAEHGIVSDIELTSVDKLAEAYDRVIRSDVKYRFVIDMATLKA